MRYSLRTLLILTILGPPVLASLWFACLTAINAHAIGKIEYRSVIGVDGPFGPLEDEDLQMEIKDIAP